MADEALPDNVREMGSTRIVPGDYAEIGKAATANAARVLALEGTAKTAYGVFAHRVGADLPWEALAERTRIAWREVVEFIEDDPACRCGEPLQCVYCDADAVAQAIASALKGEDCED